jgi:DNA (cytosine-5)-methyltransferase 1
LQAYDLFCGLGGFSAGLLDACREMNRTPELLAINHWDKAIETHKLNHPSVSHLCENLDNVDPRKVITSGKLDVLLASPECTHFSNARGGKPMSDQSRAKR